MCQRCIKVRHLYCIVQETVIRCAVIWSIIWGWRLHLPLWLTDGQIENQNVLFVRTFKVSPKKPLGPVLLLLLFTLSLSIYVPENERTFSNWIEQVESCRINTAWFTSLYSRIHQVTQCGSQGIWKITKNVANVSTWKSAVMSFMFQINKWFSTKCISTKN